MIRVPLISRSIYFSQILTWLRPRSTYANLNSCTVNALSMVSVRSILTQLVSVLSRISITRFISMSVLNSVSTARYSWYRDFLSTRLFTYISHRISFDLLMPITLLTECLSLKMCATALTNRCLTVYLAVITTVVEQWRLVRFSLHWISCFRRGTTSTAYQAHHIVATSE